METATILQTTFFKEKGIESFNSQGEPDIEYVAWLEEKLQPSKQLAEDEIEKMAEKWASERYDEQSESVSAITENTEWLNRKFNYIEGIRKGLSLSTPPVEVLLKELSEITDEDVIEIKNKFYSHIDISISEIKGEILFHTSKTKKRDFANSLTEFIKSKGYLSTPPVPVKEPDAFVLESNLFDNRKTEQPFSPFSSKIVSVYFSPCLLEIKEPNDDEIRNILRDYHIDRERFEHSSGNYKSGLVLINESVSKLRSLFSPQECKKKEGDAEDFADWIKDNLFKESDDNFELWTNDDEKFLTTEQLYALFNK